MSDQKDLYFRDWLHNCVEPKFLPLNKYFSTMTFAEILKLYNNDPEEFIQMLEPYDRFLGKLFLMKYVVPRKVSWTVDEADKLYIVNNGHLFFNKNILTEEFKNHRTQNTFLFPSQLADLLNQLPTDQKEKVVMLDFSNCNILAEDFLIIYRAMNLAEYPNLTHISFYNTKIESGHIEFESVLEKLLDLSIIVNIILTQFILIENQAWFSSKLTIHRSKYLIWIHPTHIASTIWRNILKDNPSVIPHVEELHRIYTNGHFL